MKEIKIIFLSQNVFFITIFFSRQARHIINFDFPLHISDYIHRVGRIGRIGSHEKCQVTNFVSSFRELNVVQKIEHAARTAAILPNVNANISNVIGSKIIKEMDDEDREFLADRMRK